MSTCAELEAWREKSGCRQCVHYNRGCRFFTALALFAKEASVFRDVMLPSLVDQCPMYFGPPQGDDDVIRDE